ncbi:DUF3558 domain-containing protein [Amycolatopsis rhizosphaerae]|uniref:DUF3558 domain-containing protein n=1 Tax=Amycolatopsis rhizosphaerae TaxID=2053003 RepID=A0A558BTK1_9PSEU|nr:DUF3558 domain-containing protein [Amycolatopsis rhizosphaerae]TVT39857.1 DUF3558 domain-containing protein [Amycolatopsis rhizosphaerae]
MKFRRTLLLATTALALAATACTETKTGSPSVTTSTGTSSTAEGGGTTVPKVQHPLPNIAAFAAKPCDLLSSSLIAKMGFSDPSPNTGSDGRRGVGCGWIDTENARNINISIGMSDGKGFGGMRNVYAGKGTLLKFLEPAEDVSGYPAAYGGVQDRRSRGDCSLYFGVTDDIALSADAGGYHNAQDSCAAARQIATAVIATLQGGS